MVAMHTPAVYLVSQGTWHPHREEEHRLTEIEIKQHPMNGIRYNKIMTVVCCVGILLVTCGLQVEKRAAVML